jgi:lipocalin
MKIKKEIIATSAILGLAGMILRRKPVMDSQTYNYLIALAAGKGFDVRNLVRTEQN